MRCTTTSHAVSDTVGILVNDDIVFERAITVLVEGKVEKSDNINSRNIKKQTLVKSQRYILIFPD
jgi:hypothetical protein